MQLQLETLLALTDSRHAETSSERLARKLAVALRQVARLTGLVESLLDASRMSQEALELSPSKFDLGTLARRVVTRFEDDARAARASFRVELAEVWGTWDASRLEQVLNALVSDALRYAPGAVIDVMVQGDQDTARVTVRDRGRGIPDADLARVFDRFERAVSAENFGGFGVGLYLSRKIVEAHGGFIEALKTNGPGTTIMVTLPKERLGALVRGQAETSV